MPPPVKVCLIKKGRRVREERKEAFLGGGPVESAPIAVIIIIMSGFGGDEWVGINRPKSFLITRDDKFQSSSALEMYYSASTAAGSSSDSVSPLVLARTCSFFVALEKDKKHFIIIPATSTLQIWKMRRRKKTFKKKIHYNP